MAQSSFTEALFPMMQALDKDLRGALEKTVKAARAVAEAAAHAVVEQLGVGNDKPEAFLSDAEKTLRNRLRTHGKQLGDARESKSTNPTFGKQEVAHLVQEVAYEHWHRMLFARFLADNNLLIYDGVAVTIEECDELAPDEGAKSGWDLAGKLAARMLPQVFKAGSPVFELTFAFEHQGKLERLLKGLPEAVFKASDSLGWVYQFWQANNKERINKSEVKIGADELPAVTQLFTEPYMVAFLLENSLGAWWATRQPGKPCPVNLTYFRSLEDGTPAAGKFEGWPDTLDEFKMIDPCCGSGHFLVAAFLMLVPMRMTAEGLNAKDAINRVITENIHGLEIDPRCVEIAVFAVALEAWRYPDASGGQLGVREIPAPNIACCGLKVTAKAQDWEALVPENAPNAANLREGLSRLHQTFAEASLLGSLLNPAEVNKGDLFSADYSNLLDLLKQALATEHLQSANDELESSQWELAVSAQGLLQAAQILSNKYHLLATNPPYLGEKKQDQFLRDYIKDYFDEGKSDLATAFLVRGESLVNENTQCLVLPQNWLYQKSYKKLRENLLKRNRIRLINQLGDAAFYIPVGADVLLLILSNSNDPEPFFSGIDLTAYKSVNKKIEGSKHVLTEKHHPYKLAAHGDSRIVLQSRDLSTTTLESYASCFAGILNGDTPRFVSYFWEVTSFHFPNWRFFQRTVAADVLHGGRSNIILWEDGAGKLRKLAVELKDRLHDADRRGNQAWGKSGVGVSQMGLLPATIYTGDLYDQSVAIIIPKKEEHLEAIWCYCSSDEYKENVRKIDKNKKVTNATLVKVPFDLEFWSKEAAEKYPLGLPRPYSDDPTQWIFHGHPKPATEPLQVAVARLVGYTWPAEIDDKIDLADEARAWISQGELLVSHADKGGIVCIPPVGREASASDRLLNLLAVAYGADWSNDTLAQLLTEANHSGKSLETWLRDKFFTQHCVLFDNRPFVWHVWDGLSDGFAALINYHIFDYKTLESLIYTYLGDWISRQKRDADSGVDGAQEKLAAAEALKKQLELILVGEAPYDIFVRWKPIEEQPIGWNPDLNDGVRMNIRPFVLSEDVKVKDAGVLRDRVTSRDPKTRELKLWSKDRGGDVPSAPWYELGLRYEGKLGDRINDHHLTNKEKEEARKSK
jgi:hypothetical protein